MLRNFAITTLALSIVSTGVISAEVPQIIITKATGQTSAQYGQVVPIGIPILTKNGQAMGRYSFQPVKFTLKEYGKIAIESAGYARGGARLSDFSLIGEADFTVAQFSNPFSRFRVITPSGVYEIKGTAFNLESQ